MNSFKLKKANSFKLRIASKYGYLNLVKMLEKNVHCLEDALITSSINGHVEIVKFLIEKGARILNNALFFASRNGHTEIVKLLKERAATKNENV